MSSHRALIVVDAVNDFCPGGAIPTEMGDVVCERIAAHIREHADDYRAIAFIREWHVRPGSHFASTTGQPPDFDTTWPDHGRPGTWGAQFHTAIAAVKTDIGTSPATGRPTTGEFHKGERSAAYSAFDGERVAGQLALQSWLYLAGVDEIVVCGIATEKCVMATVADGLKLGYPTTVIQELCSPITEATEREALDEMRDLGAMVVTIPGRVTPPI